MGSYVTVTEPSFSIDSGRAIKFSKCLHDGHDQICCGRVSYCSMITICHIKLLRPWTKLLQLAGNWCHILATVKTLCQVNFISLDHWKNLWKDLMLMTIKKVSSTRSELLQHHWHRFLCHGLHDDSWNAGNVVSTCQETFYWKVVKTFSCCQLSF